MPNMKRKTGRKLIRTANAKKTWTAEDDEFLRENWGRRSIKFIAHKLGRSKNAVICRVRRMGLGAYLDNGDDPTLNQVYCTIHAGANGGYGAYRLNNWIRAGLPYKEKRVDTCKFRVINIDDFWEWAEQHKDLMDFALFEKYILGEEPAWVKEKRRIDIDEALNGKRGGHNASWEPWEDEKFRRLMRKGVTIRDAAKELRKKERALIVRRKVLGIEEHFIRLPARKWTDEDVETLLTCFDKGMSWRQIGDILDRGEWACENKYEKLQNPGYFQKNNYGAKHHIDYKGGVASAAEVREVMQLRSIGALDGFEEAPEIGGRDIGI